MLDFESKGSWFIQEFFKSSELRLINAVVASFFLFLQDLGKWPKPVVHSRPSDGDVKWRSREQDLGFSVVSVHASNFGCLSLG